MSDNNNDNKKQNNFTYMVIGMCLGAGIGVVMDNVGVGLAIGMCLGLAFDMWLKKKGQ